MIGTIANSAGNGVPTTSYTLDNSQGVLYIAPNNTGPILYRQTFFKSPTVPDGDHNLTVALRSNDTAFWLDYFLVTQNISSQASFPTTVTVSVPAVTASATIATTAIPGSRLHQPGALAGIILGTLGFLAAMIAVIYLCVCRRRIRGEPTVDDYREIDAGIYLTLEEE